MSYLGMDPLEFTDPGGQERAEAIARGVPGLDLKWNHELSPFPCECGCGMRLTWGQVKRQARCASAACRAKVFEARNPRLYAASVEQLEGELLKRLGKAAGRAEGKEVTVRALTRNVRVLKRTWMKVRSMTPSRGTFMQTLEKIVHEAWLSKEEA